MFKFISKIVNYFNLLIMIYLYRKQSARIIIPKLSLQNTSIDELKLKTRSLLNCEYLLKHWQFSQEVSEASKLEPPIMSSYEYRFNPVKKAVAQPPDKSPKFAWKLEFELENQSANPVTKIES